MPKVGGAVEGSEEVNTKAKGSRRERQTMAYYTKLGYACTKSGASLGAWDILAIGPHDAYLIQVKSNRPPGKVEMAKLEAFQCPPFMHKVLVVWKDRVVEPEISPIARARAEKEVVEMLTHPIVIRKG